MVNARLLPALALLLLSPIALAGEPGLTLELDHQEIELGADVVARITAHGVPDRLAELDLGALGEDFAFDLGKSSDGAAQSIKVVLHPRRTGELTVPSLALGGARTAPHTLSVRPAATSKGSIDVHTSAAGLRVWQRQQLIVTVEVDTPQPFASLETEPWSPEGFEVVPLPVSRQRNSHPADHRESLRLGWAIFPLNAGAQTVELPRIRYVRNGLVQRVFAPPLLHVEVRALPSYVPPTLPVGRVELNAALQGPSVLHTSAITTWRVSLSSDELPPWWLPAVLRQVRSDDELKVFTVSSERSMSPDPNGVHGETVHRIPIKPLINGVLALPALRLQYFDPHKGRLVTIVYPGERYLALGPWTRLVLGVLTLLGAYALLMRFRRWWLDRRRRHRHRREALALLNGAADPVQMRAALQRLSLSEGWPANATLTAWEDRWRARFITDPALGELLGRLASGCYDTRRPVDVTTLRMELLDLIRRSRRRRRHLVPAAASGWNRLVGWVP
jgi:hypothetical protein